MNGVKKKKSPTSGGDADDVLCCCEYINQKGERSHLAACLCDCEDLDEACDRWITCKSLKPEVLARVIETASDRFRVPWIQGAKKVDIGILPPLVLLPVSLYLAAFHVLLGVVVFSSLPVLVIWYYQLTHRRKGKTLLFLSLVLFSLGYMYYTFVREVFLKGHIGWGHLFAITGGLFTTLFFLAKAKQDPGYLNKSTARAKAGDDLNGFSLGGEGTQSLQRGRSEDHLEKDFLIADKNWCKVCQVVRPSRSGHCRICGRCVLRLDHHCVWINNCIGSGNHKFFILLLLMFMFTSVYGITVTLSALCRDQYIVSALFYCPGAYADYSPQVYKGTNLQEGKPVIFVAKQPIIVVTIKYPPNIDYTAVSTSFAFTCVWYCAIVTGGVAYLLLVQLLNISYNVTEREARMALREKTARLYLGGLAVDPGTYNQGLYQNWLYFLSPDSRSAGDDLSDIV